MLKVFFSSPCQMLICTERFTGTFQGSQPSTEISFIPPLNCEKQFLWFKGSHMYYFFCLSPFLKTSEMVRWFWCVSPLSLHSSCVAHFLHSIWVTSHPLSCPVSWAFTLVLLHFKGGFCLTEERNKGISRQHRARLQSCSYGTRNPARFMCAALASANTGITNTCSERLFPSLPSQIFWKMDIDLNYLCKIFGFEATLL